MELALSEKVFFSPSFIPTAVKRMFYRVWPSWLGLSRLSLLGGCWKVRTLGKGTAYLVYIVHQSITCLDACTFIHVFVPIGRNGSVCQVDIYGLKYMYERESTLMNAFKTFLWSTSYAYICWQGSTPWSESTVDKVAFRCVTVCTKTISSLIGMFRFVIDGSTRSMLRLLIFLSCAGVSH